MSFASSTRSTLNHIALTCVDGALRRYLNDLGVELRRPITIQMPVNLRKSGEDSAGQQAGHHPGGTVPPHR
jgi:diacylglycerol O-acyltransferase